MKSKKGLTTTQKKKIKAIIADDPTIVDSHVDDFLRAEAIVEAINANLPEDRRITPIPKEYVVRKRDREVVSLANHLVFEMIGGAPGYADWAKHNKKDFYNIYAKLLPSETQTPMGTLQFNFTTAIPETPQDRIQIDEAGRVVEAEVVADEDLPE